jgi:adenylate kinase family enzyme
MPQNFIFIGRSGCGKGTQAELLIKNLKDTTSGEVFYLESGKRFRDFFADAENSYTGELSRKIYDTGGLQPEFLAVWVWSNALVKNLDDKMHLVVDGAPRKLHEAHLLDSALKFYNRHDVNVIFVDISREEAEKRLLSRGREDDKDIEDIKRRLDWYDSDVVPVISFFRDNPDYRFHRIDGEKAIEEIHSDILREVYGS